MTPQRSLRQVNYSHVLLICGMVLSLMIVMFRPSGAEAVLPSSVEVYDSFEADGAPATVKVNDLPQIKNVDYNVIFHGQTKGTKVGLTGVPLAEFLKSGGVDTTNLQFVKIRLSPGNDSVV
jgi:hypothetical protein